MYTGIIPFSVCSIVSIDIVDPSITGVIDDSDMACTVALENDDVPFNGSILTVFDLGFRIFCAAGVFDGTPQSRDRGVPGNSI